MKTIARRLTTIFVGLLTIGFSQADDFFQQQVAPILQRRCLSCHNDEQHKGDLSLQSAGSAMADGYIEPGDSDSSYLVDVITPVDDKAEMPKNSDPLSTEEITLIRKWIDDGAKWPTAFKLADAPVADLNWWSLKPLVRPVVPKFDTRMDRPQLELRTSIDAFVQAKLDSMDLTPSPEASRRTLIRRLYFDLIGLPPSPDEIQAFVDDESENAYELLVDRLLDSPHYGERWARHWLDVVHYADTHGYDKDKMRPNAWPYRDYVIRSFNEDKPYSRFVQEQIAGDVLWPNTPDGIIATGFIAAGPWDFIGHAEVLETKIDGRIARNLDRDDMVTTTMNSFCSVTVQCARCHNHKFDPVTQEHYYSLQSVFAALDRADRPFDIDPQTSARRAELKQQLQELSRQQARLDDAVHQVVGDELATIDSELAELDKQKNADNTTRPEFGYHSQIASERETEKWVQVDLGESIEIDSIVYVGCHDDFAGIGHGFGFPKRFRIEVSNDLAFESGVKCIVDHTKADVANPGTNPQTVRSPGDVKARYVRVTATKLAERSKDYIFALAELMVLDADGQNVALNKEVTSLDSIEAPVRWQRKNLVDGYFFGDDASLDVQTRIAELNNGRTSLIEERVSRKLREDLKTNRLALEQTEKLIAELPAQQMVYAGTIHHGSGAFKGTGADGGKPRTIHVLHRGDILSPRNEVHPGTIPVIPNMDWQFELSNTHDESERRVALAKWLVRRDNPLTWRSIVNRVWHYHFGRGIVDSPNDFGRMGRLPSHPELLDWLAVEFRDGGQSIKHLHRLIVTSSVYRQSSADSEANRRIDSENKYLWRMNRRRLSAEEIRDAVLVVSGKLDRKMYGPGYPLFVLERPEHSPHYEYHKHDPDDPQSHRRSVYRFIVRSQPDPFMTTLDCADSSQSVAKRDETLTALQALSLLNNKFMLRMAEHFAYRVHNKEADMAATVDKAFRLVTGHRPDEEQRAMLTDYAREFGSANLCRLLFNLNEFVFVD